MSLRLQTTFPGTPLPKNTPYMEQILASQGLVSYFQADWSHFTITSGKVSNWASKSADTTSMIASPDAVRPIVSDPIFGGQYPGVTFNGTDSMSWTGDYARALAFSWMMIFKAGIPASDGYMASTFSDVGVGTWLRLTPAGLVQFSHGNGVIGGRFTHDAPTIVIGTSSIDRIFGRVNGNDMGTVPTNNATTTNGLELGAADNVGGILNSPAAFHLADFAIWQRDILRDGALVSLLEGFARDAYDVVIAA